MKLYSVIVGMDYEPPTWSVVVTDDVMKAVGKWHYINRGYFDSMPWKFETFDAWVLWLTGRGYYVEVAEYEIFEGEACFIR